MKRPVGGVKPAHLLTSAGSFTTSTLAFLSFANIDLDGGAMAIERARTARRSRRLTLRGDLLISGACSFVICGTGQRCLDLVAYESMALSG